MRIAIQARDFALTDGLREHIERRLQFAFGWADDQLGQVSVHLFDENGPRGNKNKCCQIRIDFPGAQDIAIEDTEADVYVAIDRAAGRAGRSVAHGLDRLREYRHDSFPEATPTASRRPVSALKPLPTASHGLGEI